MKTAIKYDTAAALSALVLSAGRLAYAHDTKALKMGDGVKTFAQLADLTKAGTTAKISGNQIIFGYPSIGMMRTVWQVSKRNANTSDISAVLETIARVKNKVTTAEYASYINFMAAQDNITDAQLLQDRAIVFTGVNFSDGIKRFEPFDNGNMWLKYYIVDVPISVLDALGQGG